MSENDVRVSHIVPEDVRDRAQQNSGHGELSEAVRRVYRMYADGTAGADAATIAVEEAVLERRLEAAQTEEQAIERRKRELEERREELQQRRQNAHDRQSAYAEALDGLVAEIEDGMRVYEDHAKVQHAADIGGCSPATVIDDLKERVQGVPEHRFQTGLAPEAP